MKGPFLGLSMSTVVLLVFNNVPSTISQFSDPTRSSATSSRSFYNINDPNIIYLDKDNFESHVSNPGREYILMVQFYIDWSEGSRSVVVTYSDLARNISTWENIIRLAAINCAEERNTGVCREYGYIAFPAFKLFPPGNLMASSKTIDQTNSSSSSLVKLIEYNTISRKTHKLIPMILDYIEKLSIDKKEYINSWPNFVPIKVNSLDQLEGLFTDQTKDTTILLLIDKGNDGANRKVLMDMSVYQANLIIKQIQISPQLTRQLAKDNEPILLHTTVEKNGKSSLKLISNKEIGGGSRELITAYIETHFASIVRIKRMEPIYMADLYKGLRHSLYNEVTLHKTLNSSQVAVLASYISTIYRYFPFDNENPRRWFKRMDYWMRMRKPGKSLETIDLMAAMRVGSEGFIPQSDFYYQCKSGYPCALWLIFHTLTVSEYQKTAATKDKLLGITINDRNNFIGDKTSNETTIANNAATKLSQIDGNGKQLMHKRNHYQVLYAMRDYVKYFYSCADCKQQFTSMVANLEDRLIHSNSSIMTLWEVHNNISAFISQSANSPILSTTSSTSIISSTSRSPWPTRKSCPRCYTPSDNWDSQEIFNFLLDHYSKERTVKLRNAGSTLALSLCSNLITPVFLSSLIVTLSLHLFIN